MSEVLQGGGAAEFRHVSVTLWTGKCCTEYGLPPMSWIGGGVTVASTVTADKAQKRHRSHAGSTQNLAEYVEVHPSTHGSQRILFSKALMQESPDDLSCPGILH
ncbi:MAG: hypothetical protein ACRENK_01055 [Gemmatimonadaceae bacterium]